MRYSPSSQHRKGWTRRASYLATLCAILSTMVLSNCVRVPVDDGLAKGPQVDEIVRRVKCDLYEATADRLNAPYGYEWLHSWTVQANLNLIVNDQSQLSPGVVLTQPLKAVTVPLKLTNAGQSFNFGLGAGLNNTATRNETITFTVSLQELMDQFGRGQHNCDFPNSMDLQSELGLKQWVSAALSPVAYGDLVVGYHKTPKTGGGGSESTAKVTATLQSARTALAESKLVSPKKPGPTAKKPGGIVVDCDNPNGSSGSPNLATLQSDLSALCNDYFAIFGDETFDFQKLYGNQVKIVARTIEDTQRVIRDLILLKDPSFEKLMAILEQTAIELTTFVDPPIDTISHQVQFIIVWNANATPSWTLVNFKGPSPSSGALFSATKTKTHTLNIVIGPPSSPDSAGALQALQVGTAVGNAFSTSGAPVP
jgi:hypothetical protein